MRTVAVFGGNLRLPGIGGSVPAETIQALRALTPLTKAVSEDDGHNYRWITVHPHGKNEKGYPVKIRVNPDGTGTVVAGAGGSMNYMKLTKLKSEKEWKQEARRRRQERREEESAKTDAQKEAESKAKQELDEQEEETKAELFQTVAQEMGWEESVRIPEEKREHMPEDSIRRIEKARARSMEKKVEETVEDMQEKAIREHDAQVAQELGGAEIDKLDTEAEQDHTGLGYVESIERAAEEAGLTETELQHMSDETRMKAFERAEAEGYIEEAERAEQAVEKLLEGAAEARREDAPYRAEGLHQPDVEPELEDPKKAKDVLMAYTKYKEKMREIRAGRREVGKASDVDEALEIAKGVTMAVAESPSITDVEKLEEKLENDLQQRALQEASETLVEEVEEAKEKGAGPAEHHINTGRYNMLNEALQTILNEPAPVDRLIADHMGAEAAAQLAAYALRQRLERNDLEDVRRALEEEHVETQREIAEGAAEEAAELIQEADEIVEGIDLENADADDLLTVELLNEERERLLAEAATTLGEATGRLEMAGHLNFALEGDTPDELRIAMGQVGSKRIHQLAAALGLERGEYEAINDIGNNYMAISREAFDKLLSEPEPDVAEAYETAVAIKRGEHDEEGWLPEGFRAPQDLPRFEEAEEAFSFARDLNLEEGMSEEEVQEEAFAFLDRAMADNPYNPRAVRRECTTQAFIMDNVPTELQRAWNDALVEYFPPHDLEDDEYAEAMRQRVEDARKKLIEAGVISSENVTLDSQTISDGKITVEAMHETVADMPTEAQAFVPVTEENRYDVQAAVRDYFWENLTEESREEAAAERAAAREAREKAEEVVGQQQDIFGGAEDVQRGESEYEETEADPDAWQRYVATFGSTADAHEAVRDHMRGAFMEKFKDRYETRTGQALQTGTKQVPNFDRFLIGTLDEEGREMLLEIEQEKRSKLGAEVAMRDDKGRFLPGARREMVDELLKRQRDAHQADFGFDFGEEETDTDFTPISDRTTLGSGVEEQISKMLPTVARNFEPGEPADLPPEIRLDGDYVKQQRAIKLVEQNKRIGAHLGVGSGKTIVGLGAFTHLQKQGKANRGLYAVPSVVAEQFATEALRFLEPRGPGGDQGYTWNVAAGQSRDERLESYKDPGTDMVFVTHQALRDDIIHEVAQAHHGGDEDAASDWLRNTPEAERRSVVQDTLRDAGWSFDYSMIDEGHDLLNRKGKPNSAMANAIDDLTADHEYHINATGTPVKNDVSEAFDVLRKLRPDKYPQEKWGEFSRRYGMNTQGAREALQREMAPYVMADKIKPDSTAQTYEHSIPLSNEQASRYREVLGHYRQARQAEPGSREHVEAMENLAPEHFEGKSAEEKLEVAEGLGGAKGMLRDMTLRQVTQAQADLPPEQNAKLQHVLDTAQKYSNKGADGDQLPGIVFAHHLEPVAQIKEQLEEQGYRVGIITGKHSSSDKEAAKTGFHPPIDVEGMSPEEREAARREAADYDILVASDAAACGANLQRAGWLYHYDQPMTAKTHEQRTGRAHRIGQVRDTVHVHNAISDTPLDKRAWQRVLDKYDLAQTFQEPTEMLDDTGLARRLRMARAERMDDAAQDVFNPGVDARQEEAEEMREATG